MSQTAMGTEAECNETTPVRGPVVTQHSDGVHRCRRDQRHGVHRCELCTHTWRSDRRWPET